MRISKYFIIILLSSVSFISCNKADEEELYSFADYPFTVCTDYKLSVDEGSKFNTNLSRGWEGDVDEDAQLLPTKYPMDKIYLFSITNNTQGNIKYETLEFPVYELDGKQVLDICFRAEGSKLWAKNGADSILVANGAPLQSFFSSCPTLETSMELGEVKTEGDKQTYDPYGDRLFKTANLMFMAVGDQVMYLPDYKPVTELSLEMERLTNVIIPRFVLCEDLQTPKSEYTLDLLKFTSVFGPVEYWEVRAFVAGNQEADSPFCNGFPVDYNLLSGTDENGSRGIINVAKGYQELDADFVHNTVSVGGKATSYKGVGYHSGSTPFILPAMTGGKKSDLCFTFRYIGNDPEIKAKLKNEGVMTYRFHATEDLTEGTLRLVTVVMDIEDFVKRFLKTSSRANIPVYVINDSDFGQSTVASGILLLD